MKFLIFLKLMSGKSVTNRNSNVSILRKTETFLKNCQTFLQKHRLNVMHINRPDRHVSPKRKAHLHLYFPLFYFILINHKMIDFQINLQVHANDTIQHLKLICLTELSSTKIQEIKKTANKNNC